jgi:hypothetical protein
LRAPVPSGRRRTGADPISARACLSPDDRAIPRLQAKTTERSERRYRSGRGVIGEARKSLNATSGATFCQVRVLYELRVFRQRRGRLITSARDDSSLKACPFKPRLFASIWKRQTFWRQAISSTRIARVANRLFGELRNSFVCGLAAIERSQLA